MVESYRDGLLAKENPMMLTLFTALHPLVDFCSVAVLAMGGVTFERCLTYNALAFALELPLGVLLDARPQLAKRMFGVSLALLLSGVALCVLIADECDATGACALSKWVALALACIGNALFHLTAGASVLEIFGGKSGPVGLFISTGALGLMAGEIVVNHGCTWAVILAAVMLIVGTTWQLVLWRPMEKNHVPSNFGFHVLWSCWGLVLLGLFALVVWRSWTGLLAGGMTSSSGFMFALMGAAVTWAGKMTGGYVADAINGNIWPRGLITVISVAGSAVLCSVCSPSHAVLWLVLLFVAQLATGPVLSLMYDAIGRRAGTSFGINCLGIFTGSLF